MYRRYDEIVSEKLLKIHSLTIFGVCVLFGLINMLAGTVMIGVLIVGGGLLLAILGIFFSQISLSTRGMILAQAQALLIIGMSIAKHEMHSMFPLMTASLAVAALYFSVRILAVQLTILDIAGILGIIFRGFMCGGQSIEFLAKGIAGINIAGAMIIYLVRCIVKALRASQAAEDSSSRLVGQVRDQMDEAQLQAKKQKHVVDDIMTIAVLLGRSSGKMLEISERLSEATDEEESTIRDIHTEMAEITEETEKSMEESRRASESAKQSSMLLAQNNEDIQAMLAAMGEIESSSAQIGGIVKTIEDIAFQTNLLAVNASVEAARAGTAGKGFAVVADEVRSLALKSQEAVKNTAVLIESSLSAVERGKEVADKVAGSMQQVIESAKESEGHAALIAGLCSRQAEFITEVTKHVDQISEIISKNSQTSSQSSEIAGEVAEQVQNMKDSVRDFM